MKAQVSMMKSKSRLSASENRKDIDDTHTHTRTQTNMVHTNKLTYALFNAQIHARNCHAHTQKRRV